jgi:hypothetical protein
MLLTENKVVFAVFKGTIIKNAMIALLLKFSNE